MLNYTPIGFVDDDPRKRNIADHRRARARHARGAAAGPARAAAGRGADRDAVRLGRRARPDRRDRAGVEDPGEDAAGPLRADHRRPESRESDPPGAGRGRARPRAGRGRLRAGRLVSPRPHGARHRRRRLDRLGALPPDRARRAGAADPRRQRRDAALRDRARARRRARASRPRSRCSPTSRTACALRSVFESYRPHDRLPRRRVQARAADGGESAGGRHEQRARDARDRVASRSSSASSGSC